MTTCFLSSRESVISHRSQKRDHAITIPAILRSRSSRGRARSALGICLRMTVYTQVRVPSAWMVGTNGGAAGPKMPAYAVDAARASRQSAMNRIWSNPLIVGCAGVPQDAQPRNIDIVKSSRVLPATFQYGGHD